MNTQIDINQVYDIRMNNVITQDYPDFCDAYVGSARWKHNDKNLTDDELEALQEQYPDEMHEKAHECWL